MKLPTNPKYMGLCQQGKSLPLEGGMGGDCAKEGNHLRRKERLVLTSMGIWECLSYVPLVGSLSLIFSLLIHIQNHMMGDTHKCLITSGVKRADILSLSFRYDATSRCLYYQWMGLWGGGDKYFN